MNNKTVADRANTESSAKNDLRRGMHGSLAVPETKIVGGEPLFSLEDPKLATPDFATPPGQVTHE